MPSAIPAHDNAYVLHTEQLILRLADPTKDGDCQTILDTVTRGGHAKSDKYTVKTLEDIRYKHQVHGPKSKYCTLAAPPNGLFFLAFLRTSIPQGDDVEGDLVGIFPLAFRPEFKYPDFGYALLSAHRGKGFATEAGREIVKFWRERVGVREICILTSDSNEAGKAVAEKLGFVKAGKYRNEWREDEDSGYDGLGYVSPGMSWGEGWRIVHFLSYREKGTV